MRRRRGVVTTRTCTERRSTRRRSIKRRRTKKKEKRRIKTEAKISTRRRKKEKKSTKIRQRTRTETRIKAGHRIQELKYDPRVTMKTSLDTIARLKKSKILSLRRSWAGGSEMKNEGQQTALLGTSSLQLREASTVCALQLQWRRKVVINWFLTLPEEEMRISPVLCRKELRDWALVLLLKSKELQLVKRFQTSLWQSQEGTTLQVDNRSTLQVHPKVKPRVHSLLLPCKRKILGATTLLIHCRRKELGATVLLVNMSTTLWVQVKEELRACSLLIQCRRKGLGAIIFQVVRRKMLSVLFKEAHSLVTHRRKKGVQVTIWSQTLLEQHQKKNDGRGQPLQNLSSSIQRSTKSIGLTPKMEKERDKDSERSASNDMVSDFVGAAQRKNGRMGQQAGNLTPSIQRNADGIGLAPKMEKEVVKDSGMVPNAILTEKKRNDWIGQPVEKFSEKKKERKEKSKEKKTKEGKGEEHKNRDRNEKKSKRKDKDRHKEKEKEEKKRGESDDKHKEHDKLEEIRKNNQLDNITKSVAPQAENANTIAADGNIKKRKEIQINGFLHETDGRPNKLPRTSPSSSRTMLDNGKILELSHIPLPCSIKFDAIDKPMAELSGNKESVLNGKAGGHSSSVALRPPVIIASGDSSKVSSKTLSRPPHPDTKFLSTVYSVPKMDELHEFDDQEWLFSSTNQKPSTKLEDEVLPQVWANGLQIESADVFALPYVIPF